MIDWIAVRDGLANLLTEVPGVNIVHNFPRLQKDGHIGRTAKLMTDQKRINAWTVYRDSASAEYQTCQEILVTHDAVFIGFMEHNDEFSTQDEFDRLVDSILEKFNAHYRLDGAVEIQGPAQLTTEELRQYANTTVHYAEIHISAVQRTHI